jgi:hypothetical protein
MIDAFVDCELKHNSANANFNIETKVNNDFKNLQQQGTLESN